MDPNDEEIKEAFTTPNMNLGKKPLFKAPIGAGAKLSSGSKPTMGGGALGGSDKKPTALFAKPKMFGKKKF